VPGAAHSSAIAGTSSRLILGISDVSQSLERKRGADQPVHNDQDIAGKIVKAMAVPVARAYRQLVSDPYPRWRNSKRRALLMTRRNACGFESALGANAPPAPDR
jgi:hypothetical protein